MERSALFLLIGAAVATGGEPGEPTACPRLHYYTELGCAAAASNASRGCAEYYTCPELHADPSKCYYRGVSYSDGDALPADAVKNPCSISCYCSVRNTSGEIRAEFDCAAVDCVEDFSSDTEEECVSAYTLEDCCSSGRVCGKDLAKLSTCEVDGVTYREGQQFYQARGCQVCLCTRDFDGATEDAGYCRRVDCGIETHYQAELASGCAPVTLSGDSCCPHKWQCADNSTQIIKSPTPPRVQATCTFGNETLRVGDRVQVQDDCVACSCDVPPLVSCTQRMGC